MNADLVQLLVCPETHQSLSHAPASLISGLNQRIAAGTLKNRGGEVTQEPLEAGLLRSDGRVLYPVRHGIPIMLIVESLEGTTV